MEYLMSFYLTDLSTPNQLSILYYTHFLKEEGSYSTSRLRWVKKSGLRISQLPLYPLLVLQKTQVLASEYF